LRGLAEGTDEGAAHPSLDMPVYEPDEEHATAQGLNEESMIVIRPDRKRS
jgi:hypothetical protein